MTDFGAQCGAQTVDLTENRHLEDITEKWPPPRTFEKQEQRSGGTAPGTCSEDKTSNFEHCGGIQGNWPPPDESSSDQDI